MRAEREEGESLDARNTEKCGAGCKVYSSGAKRVMKEGRLGGAGHTDEVGLELGGAEGAGFEGDVEDGVEDS